MEIIHLRSLPLSLPSFEGMASDMYAAQLLRTYAHNDTAVPLAVSADGNCFFNSLSVALTGSEDLALQLRLRYAIYVLLHTESLSDDQYTDNKLTPCLADDLKAICQEGRWSSFRAFVASVEVVQCPIDLVYLPVNGPNDKVCGMMNKTITPSAATS